MLYQIQRQYHFLKIDCIDLLEKLFGQVLIPQAVFDELTADERFKHEATDELNADVLLMNNLWQ